MTPEPHPPSLLIVGGTKAGKTHYGGQLLRRLEAKKHSLRIVGAPSDLTPFQEVLDRLAQGRSAPHTPTAFYRESIWNVESENREHQAQLVWPDYGGEQIEDIVKRRQVSEPWVQRIRESNGWLFFVRLSSISSPEDVLNRPRVIDRMQSGSEAPGVPPGTTTNEGETKSLEPTLSPGITLSSQAGLVELLQALLFVKQVGSNHQLRNPPLLVVLSCCDEIGGDNALNDPATMLKQRVPLLSDFIESTWAKGRTRVVGLSALGKSLDDELSDETFMDSGPERQGWCVRDGGKQSDDLTLPVMLLMEMTRHGQ